jgi:hypothetical protein
MRHRGIEAGIGAAIRIVMALVAVGAAGAWGDEGMWLLNAPPREQLRERYGFEVSDPWLEHVQKSAVRFQTGGSGSIVSADGLVMTNHHIGSEMLAKLSTTGHDLLKTGFYAASRDQELKCPDLELNVLWSIEDVTGRVEAAAKGKRGEEAGAARRSAIAAIEAEAQDKTGLKSEVVTLFQGGRYHLYRYKRYTDVRLVMAPEESIAFFGGDTDNFEFPRFDLDMCFFRIYEDSKPLRAEHYLKWSPAGSKEGDLALVFGHPGRTERLYTVDHLKFLRDVQVPTSLRYLWRQEVKLMTFAGRDGEHARMGREDWLEVANSRKAYTGQIEGLTDPALLARKAAAEGKLRETVRGSNPWLRMTGTLEEYRGFYLRNYLLNRAFENAALYKKARHLVRMADEKSKPDGERLKEYQQSGLESTDLELYSPAPVETELEVAKLAWALENLVENFGGEDPLVVKALAGQSPRQRAAGAVRGTKLIEVEARRELAKGGKAAVEGSKDPLIVLARAIEPEAVAMRRRFESKVENVQREAYSEIAAAKFAAEGDRVYPDATFTLRMAYGPVKGYEEGGKKVPAYTTLAGLYERAEERKGSPDFVLDERWIRAKDTLDLSTPFNFVCTADIIGGNSGSPVVNTRGEVIGLIFDGNLASLPWAFEYSDERGRAVAVDSRAIMEGLKKVYGAGLLVAELTGSR